MPDIYLYSWERGYNDKGLWSKELAIMALRNIRHARQLDKAAYASSTREQSFTDNQQSPTKRKTTATSKNKRHCLYKCGTCSSTTHNTQTCRCRGKRTRVTESLTAARQLFPDSSSNTN
jgi:hypothetical protein